MPQDMSERESAFFEHLSLLSAEYERMTSENRHLRWELAELNARLSDAHDVQVSPVVRGLRQEAVHGAVEESLRVDEVHDFQEDEMSPRPRDTEEPIKSNSLTSKNRDSRRESRRQSVDSKAAKGRATLARPMFGHADDMQAAIANEMEPKYDVKNFYKTSGWAQWLARHTWFENFTMTIIVLYAFYMSLDADLNPATTIMETHPVFIVFEQFFCLYFFLELVVRFLAFERKCQCLRDAWFVFDLALVVMMVAETWVMNIVILALASLGGSGANFLGDASILRMARLMRLTRLLRMARLIRLVPELLILVKAIASAGRSVGFTLLLLGICLYVFAIAFRMTLEGTTVGTDRFYNVPISMHSLFMHGTFLDAVSDVMQELLNDNLIGFVLMYFFIILSAVTIMNMLIGILCEVITAVADAEKNALQVSWTTEVMQKCLEEGVDTDKDGQIDRAEFRDMIENPKVRKVLNEVDVDVQTLANFIDVLFEDELGGVPLTKLPFGDFMTRLLKLRGSNTATVKDLVDLRKWISRELKETRSSDPLLLSRSCINGPEIRKPELYGLMPGQVPETEKLLDA